MEILLAFIYIYFFLCLLLLFFYTNVFLAISCILSCGIAAWLSLDFLFFETTDRDYEEKEGQ